MICFFHSIKSRLYLYYIVALKVYPVGIGPHVDWLAVWFGMLPYQARNDVVKKQGRGRTRGKEGGGEGDGREAGGRHRRAMEVLG